MYQGDDRTEQVNALKDLAYDIVANTGIGCPADARFAVSEWVDGSEPMPAWFDDHDRGLLVQWVATETLHDRLYLRGTGQTYFIELGKGYIPTGDDYGVESTGVEIVVLTPEQVVAYRRTSHDLDCDWEIGTPEDVALFVLNEQGE